MPIAEFIAKISKFSYNRYIIEIPKALRPLASRLYRREVKVLLLDPGEEVAVRVSAIEPDIGYDKDGNIVIAGWFCSVDKEKKYFIQYMLDVQYEIAQLFKNTIRRMSLTEFLLALAYALNNARNEYTKKRL